MYRARRLAHLFVLAVIAPATALAYPISPEPLWPLTAEAELIVVAEVSAVEDLPRNEDSWVSAVARLRVIETLKGQRVESMRVPHAANLVCPAPPRYAVGETVVAFLRREDEGWRTVSLSYGTLYPRGAELEDMITMVRAAAKIQQTVSRTEELETAKREWLVQAAALPGTRWHGLYELAPRSDSVRSAYDHSRRPAKLVIESRHQALLAEAFVRTPKIDTTFSMMLGVLRGVEDSRVDQLALEVLEQLLALEQPPWWIRDLLWAVLYKPRPE